MDESINGRLFIEEIQILKKCEKHQITFGFKCGVKKNPFLNKEMLPFLDNLGKNFFHIQRQKAFFYFNESVYGA